MSIRITCIDGGRMDLIHHGNGGQSSIQDSQEHLKALMKRYGFTQKAVSKWKKWLSVADLATGPKVPRSTVLSVKEEAIEVS